MNLPAVDIDQIPDCYQRHARIWKWLGDRPGRVGEVVWRVCVPATGTGILVITCGAKFQCHTFAAEERKGLQHTGNRLSKLDLIDPGVWIQNITDDSQQPLICDIL